MVTMDATLDDLVSAKWLHCMRLYFLFQVSTSVLLELFCCRVCLLEMETFSEDYLLESPLLKILPLNNGKSEIVTALFASRNGKGEFNLLFNDLLDQKICADYFIKNPETFHYILTGIEGSI